MTAPIPQPGADTAVPKERPIKDVLRDIHLEVVHLAGLLHILDQFDPEDRKGQGAVVSLIAVAEPLALKIADDLEEVMG